MTTTAVRTELPIKRDWNMTRGSDFARTIKLKEADGVTVRVTTGYAMTMTIKASPNGETYATLAIGTGITNTPSSGQFNISIPAATNAAYDFSSAVYQIIITDASGGITIPFVGNIILS